MRPQKFKAQPTNAFFATVNQMLMTYKDEYQPTLVSLFSKEIRWIVVCVKFLLKERGKGKDTFILWPLFLPCRTKSLQAQLRHCSPKRRAPISWRYRMIPRRFILSDHLIIKHSTTRVKFVLSPGSKLTSLLSWHCYKTLIATTIFGKLLDRKDKSYTRLWQAWTPHSSSNCYFQ